MHLIFFENRIEKNLHFLKTGFEKMKSLKSQPASERARPLAYSTVLYCTVLYASACARSLLKPFVVERLVHSTRGYDSPALSVGLTAGAASEHAGDARCAADGVHTSRLGL